MHVTDAGSPGCIEARSAAASASDAALAITRRPESDRECLLGQQVEAGAFHAKPSGVLADDLYMQGAYSNGLDVGDAYSSPIRTA
jgi:hypothetical protein